jgi:hypothetical protein
VIVCFCRQRSNDDLNWRQPKSKADLARETEEANSFVAPKPTLREAPEWDDPAEEGAFDDNGNFVASNSRQRTTSASGTWDDAAEAAAGANNGGGLDWRKQLSRLRTTSTNSDGADVPPPGLTRPEAAAAAAKEAVSLELLEWTYLDNEGKVQGPFEGKKMQNWYDGGHLPGSLQLKRKDDVHYFTLETLQCASVAHRERPFLEPLPDAFAEFLAAPAPLPASHGVPELQKDPAPPAAVHEEEPPAQSLLARIRRVGQPAAEAGYTAPAARGAFDDMRPYEPPREAAAVSAPGASVVGSRVLGPDHRMPGPPPLQAAMPAPMQRPMQAMPHPAHTGRMPAFMDPVGHPTSAMPTPMQAGQVSGVQATPLAHLPAAMAMVREDAPTVSSMFPFSLTGVCVCVRVCARVCAALALAADGPTGDLTHVHRDAAHGSASSPNANFGIAPRHPCASQPAPS